MTDPRSESGFTLVEVIVVTVISAIIMGAMGGAIIVALRAFPDNASRLSQSNDAQLLTSWLVPDVLSAGPATSPSQLVDSSGTPNVQCGNGIDPGSSHVLELKWSNFDKPDTTFEVDYRQLGSAMFRYFCQIPGTATRTPVGRNVQIATSSNPPGGSQDPNLVALTVTDIGTPGYTFTVSASRRTGTVPTPTSTTTLQPSTPGTTLPCTISVSSAQPSPDQRADGNSGNLQVPVQISLTTTGFCRGLTVTADTGNGPATVTLASALYGQKWSGTIGQSDYTWKAGSHPLSVVDQSSSLVGSKSGTNPIPFTVQ